MNHVFYKKLDGCSCGSRGFIYLATWRAFLKYRPWRWYIDEELVKIFDDLMWFDDWDNQKYVKLGQLCSVEMQRFIFRRYFIIKLQCRYSTPNPKKKNPAHNLILGPFISALFLLFLSFLVALVFYPIFACLNSSSRMLGSAVGFLYTLLLWVFLSEL